METEEIMSTTPREKSQKANSNSYFIPEKKAESKAKPQCIRGKEKRK